MNPNAILDPAVLARIQHLTLFARETVERALTGIHRSSLHGSSIEFTEHKEYSHGDDLKNVDWKLYGKTDRHYIKQFEHETAVPAHIVLDASGSMRYGSGRPTKWEQACRLGAALVHLLLRQQDPVGLVALDSQVREFIPPRSRGDHLHVLLRAMAALEPQGETRLADALDALAMRMKRRGMVILIGDLFDTGQNFLQRLAHLRGRRNDVMVLQVVDPAELEFPFTSLTEFEDMEGPNRLLVDPRELKSEYQAEINGFLESIRKHCQDNRIDYRLVRTDEPVERVLSDFIARREGKAA